MKNKDIKEKVANGTATDLDKEKIVDEASNLTRLIKSLNSVNDKMFDKLKDFSLQLDINKLVIRNYVGRLLFLQYGKKPTDDEINDWFKKNLGDINADE